MQQSQRPICGSTHSQKSGSKVCRHGYVEPAHDLVATFLSFDSELQLGAEQSCGAFIEEILRYGNHLLL